MTEDVGAGAGYCSVLIVNTVYGVPSIRWQVRACSRGNAAGSDITIIGAVWSIL